ncbi:MAG: ComEC/Rec2 family competence protein [Mucinivorans sp.]
MQTDTKGANPMFPIAISLVVGIIVARYWLLLVDKWWLWVVVGLIVAAVVAMDIVRHNSQPILLFLIAIAGFTLYTQSSTVEKEILPYDQKIDFTAQTLSKVEQKGRYERCKVQIISLRDSSSRIWHAGSHLLELNIDTALRLSPERGNCITFSGKLRQITGSYGEYMMSQGIVGKVYTYRATIIDSTASQPTFTDHMQRRRERVAQRIYKLDTNQIAATSLMSALAIGERSEMPRELKTDYRRMGVSHLLAISGMNVGIIFAVLNVLLGVIRLVKHGRVIFGSMVIAILWAYALLTGMSPSVVRAVVMFSLLQVGLMSSRSFSSLNILSTAAVLMLAFKADYLFDIGFQLSFLAMVGIVTLYEPISSLLKIRNRILNAIWNVTVISLSAEVAVLPLVAYYFGQIPLMGLVMNLAVWLTVPVITVGTLVFLITWIGVVGTATMWVAVAQNYIVSLFAPHWWVSIEGLTIPIYVCLAAYAILITLAAVFIKIRAKSARRQILQAKYSI